MLEPHSNPGIACKLLFFVTRGLPSRLVSVEEDPPTTMDAVKSITGEFLAAARQGDEGVSCELVKRLYPLVISIVRRNLPRNESEEDLAQDIFLKVFSCLHQFVGKQPFEHWVSRIALNTCYDRLRRQEKRPVMTYAELGADEATFLEQARAPDSRQAEGSPGLAREVLAKLFTALKPREQMIIQLLDLEEKTVAEVSTLTGWGASRIRVTAFRARRKLGQALEKLEQPPCHD
jgi:RNA polymerase sigma factor (sigma-70 family)